MTADDVLKYFGTGYGMQKAIGIPSQNVSAWKRWGYIPLTMQSRLEELTHGKLVADKTDPKRIKDNKGR